MSQNLYVDQPAQAVGGWQAFAAEGKVRMAEEIALSAIYDQLYPLRALVDSRQPKPIRFYGPGPDGRVQIHDPPVGTLHVARWRHELAATRDPDGYGYYHEENPMTINGQQIRPTYITKGNQTAREVNYFRWERVPEESIKHMRTFPGLGTSRAVYDEYLLNEDDFNDPDAERRKVSIGFNNREDEDPETIYPLGYKLLKKWSQANGNAEWREGNCLGVDPDNPDALTKHLGWFSKRPRRGKAGLGADPQDAIWKEIFHGNIHAKPKEKFSPPKDSWSTDPDKIMIMASSENLDSVNGLGCIQTLHVLSVEALKAGLPPPEPDTLHARKIWLDVRSATRSGFGIKEEKATSVLADEKSEMQVTVDSEMTADTELENSAAGRTIDNIEIELRNKLEITEIVEHKNPMEIRGQPKAAETSTNSTSKENKMTTRDFAAEEREAIEARLQELSKNPEPGKEGKTPILVYSAFRSKLLGIPVTQVLGYE
ncbi:hypothetical protein F5Y03DRAFT_403063 [Xylaria venustula]|nr:hypothetical protein F5Y03DRAFT_403063 [Xylaria venustula]